MTTPRVRSILPLAVILAATAADGLLTGVPHAVTYGLERCSGSLLDWHGGRDDSR
jgi:hypothetical protein